MRSDGRAEVSGAAFSFLKNKMFKNRFVLIYQKINFKHDEKVEPLSGTFSEHCVVTCLSLTSVGVKSSAFL